MTRTITIICWVIVAIVLIGLAVWFLTGSLFGIDTGFKLTDGFSSVGFEVNIGPYNQSYEYNASTDSVESIQIDWISGTVSVTPYSGDDIRITERAQRELTDREFLRYEMKGGTLVINYCGSGSFKNLPSKQLEILIPQSLASDLNKLEIDVTSAEVTVQSLTAERVEFDSTSGAVYAAEINASEIGIETISGKIELTDAKIARVSLSSVSGQIVTSSVTADKIDCETTSGAQRLSGSFSEAKLSAVSGAISLASQIMPDQVDCETTSGSIKLYVPEAASVSVHYDSVSGRFSCAFPVSLVSRGDAQFRLSTVSGSMAISALRDAPAA